MKLGHLVMLIIAVAFVISCGTPPTTPPPNSIPTPTLPPTPEPAGQVIKSGVLAEDEVWSGEIFVLFDHILSHMRPTIVRYVQ